MGWLRILFSRSAAFFAARSLTPTSTRRFARTLTSQLKNVQAGMPLEQARTAALRAFGGVTQTREAYRTRARPRMG